MLTLVALFCVICLLAGLSSIWDQIKADEERTRRELAAFTRNTQEDE
jgi:hypothetical protein